MENSRHLFNDSLPYDSLNSFGPAEAGEFGAYPTHGYQISLWHHMKSVANNIDSDDRLDFTPLFEDTILSILPSAILLILLPFRILALRRRPRKVAKSSLHGNKLVCYFLLSKSPRDEVYSICFLLLMALVIPCSLRIDTNGATCFKHTLPHSENSSDRGSSNSYFGRCTGTVRLIPYRAYPLCTTFYYYQCLPATYIAL